MLSEKLMTDVLKFIESKVTTAEMILNEEVKEVPILKTEIRGDLLKIYTNVTEGRGTITDIYIKDKDGNIMISKPRSILKNSQYGLVSSFYIRIREEIIDNPINLFEMGGLRE